MIRTLLFYPGIIISLILSLPASLKVKSLDAKNHSDKKAEYIHKTTKKWASFIMKLSGLIPTYLCPAPNSTHCPLHQAALFLEATGSLCG